MTAARAIVSRNCTNSNPAPLIVPAIQRIAVAAYGVAADARSAGRLAAIEPRPDHHCRRPVH